MSVVFSCSIQERIPSIANTMELLEATSLFIYKRVIPTAVLPYKQGVEVAGPLELHGGDTEPGLAFIP